MACIFHCSTEMAESIQLRQLEFWSAVSVQVHIVMYDGNLHLAQSWRATEWYCFSTEFHFAATFVCVCALIACDQSISHQ